MNKEIYNERKNERTKAKKEGRNRGEYKKRNLLKKPLRDPVPLG